MPILADTHNGQLRIQGNEVIIDAKDADASKFRVGSRHVPGQSGGGGAYSFDVINTVEEGSYRKEVAILVGGFNGQQGEIGVCVWNGQEPFGDATQIKVMEIRGTEVEFKVPVKLSAGVSGLNAGDRMTSSNGRFVTIQQNDGNFVTYDAQLGPIGSPDAAIWSAWGGKIERP